MTTPASDEIRAFAQFVANLRTGELFRDGVRVRLPDQSFRVLTLLLERPGELVTREEIHNRLWPADTFVDFDHGLNNAVNRLREALGDSAETPRFIETLPRRGYRFIAPGNGVSSKKAGDMPPLQSVQLISHDEAVEPVSLDKGGLTRSIGQPRISWKLVGAEVSVLLIAVLLIAVVFHRAPDPPSTRSFVLPPEGITFNLIGDSGGAVALSPDGTRLAFVGLNAKGMDQIWVRPLGKLTSEVVAGTEGATFPFWSSDSRSLGFFADGKLKRIELEGGAAIALCEAPFGRGGSWNSRGTIIFAPDSHSAIFKVADTGGTPVPITTIDGSVHTTHRWPKFLPDGEHFLYLAANHFPDTTHNGLYYGSTEEKESKLIVSSNADGTYASGYLFFLRNDLWVAQPFDPKIARLYGTPRPTSEQVLYDPTIWKAVFDAADGRFLAYQLGAQVTGAQFRWFDRSGKQLGVLGEPSFQWEPNLSPDGRNLAVGIQGSGYSNLWTYDLVRGGRMQITFGKYDSGAPIWSPDGGRIFFNSKRLHYSLYQVDSSGTQTEQLVLDTGSDIWPLDLSHDGKYLLFGQGVNIGRSRSQLWIYPMNKRDRPFRLLDDDAIQASGRFAPDGRWITYASNESGRDEVYVIPFDPGSLSRSAKGVTGKQRWQVSIAGGLWPRWSRDGREIYYLAPDNTLMAVPVSIRGPKFEAGAPHPLFHYDPGLRNISYDVTSDGNRFIVSTPPRETNAPITLVENWLSDFKGH